MFGMASDETDALKIQTYICTQTKILTQKGERVDLINTQQQSLLLRPHKTGELMTPRKATGVVTYRFSCDEGRQR